MSPITFTWSLTCLGSKQLIDNVWIDYVVCDWDQKAIVERLVYDGYAIINPGHSSMMVIVHNHLVLQSYLCMTYGDSKKLMNNAWIDYLVCDRDRKVLPKLPPPIRPRITQECPRKNVFKMHNYARECMGV